MSPADANDIDALAAAIQAEVDALVSATGVDKIVLLAHMQQIGVEQQLATRLRGVDIIVAGGSNTILADANDRLREGDTAGGSYPLEFTSAVGEPVLLVNTDGDYRYLGRLVVGFDGAGRLLPASIDPADSGAFASDVPPFAFDPLASVDTITDALEEVLVDKDGNVQGMSAVYLDGRRSEVRSEETNLGNLTADANRWYARHTDPSVQLSLKNGGGIRSDIGLILQPPGTSDPSQAQFLPPVENASSGKPSGGVSQLDLETALRFNNSLVLVTLTAAELVDVIEHGVANAGPGVSSGRFPQIAGLRFSWDPAQPGRDSALGDANRGAATVPSRVRNLAIVDDSGAVIDQIVVDGALVGDLGRSYRLVTLGFLASDCVIDATASCGDGYPYKGLAAPNKVDLTEAGASDPGLADFSATGGEQDALAEYLQAFFAEVGFDVAETDPAADLRIQNLDAVAADSVHALPTRGTLAVLGRFQKPGAGFDEGAAEIVAFDPTTDRLFVINAEDGQIDVLNLANPASPQLASTLDPVADIGGAADGVNSVAVGGGFVAAAVEFDPAQDAGRVALYDAGTLAFVGSACTLSAATASRF